ncbi:MAG: hypothetical protein Q9201_000310 [Fulgogasparrea decipioides]
MFGDSSLPRKATANLSNVPIVKTTRRETFLVGREFAVSYKSYQYRNLCTMPRRRQRQEPNPETFFLCRHPVHGVTPISFMEHTSSVALKVVASGGLAITSDRMAQWIPLSQTFLFAHENGKEAYRLARIDFEEGKIYISANDMLDPEFRHADAANFFSFDEFSRYREKLLFNFELPLVDLLAKLLERPEEVAIETKN